MTRPAQDPGGAPRTTRRWWTPATAILLVAPFVGETFSTASSPLQLVLPWNLALVVGLYGCGVLVCREVAHRCGLGLAGLCLLGAAYAVYEEGLIDRFWFDPAFWDDSGVGRYAVVGEANVLVAAHLTVFHVAVSVCTSVLVVERMFPAARDRAWVGRRGLVACAVVLVVVVPLRSWEFHVPSPASLTVAAALLVGAVVAAFVVPRRTGDRAGVDGPRRRGVAWTAFAATALQFGLTYLVPHLGVPWPLGVGIALAPAVLGVVVLRRLVATDRFGRDGWRVVCGSACFFLVLDVAVGLLGRPDLALGAIGAAVVLWCLGRRAPWRVPDATTRAPAPRPGSS